MGNVRNTNFNKTRKTKALKQKTNKGGYKEVQLSNSGARRTVLVHRLVCCTFNNVDLNTKLYICHKDDNPSNNQLSNLFLGTPKDNIQDALSKDRICRGDKRKDHKLKEADIPTIRNMYKKGNISQRKLASIFGVSQRLIHGIIHYEYRKYL